MRCDPSLLKTDWTATAKAIGGRDKSYLLKVSKRRKTNKRIFDLLSRHEVKKVNWRAVAEVVSKERPTPYKPRYVYEVAKGYRSNKRLSRQLADLGVVEPPEIWGDGI